MPASQNLSRPVCAEPLSVEDAHHRVCLSALADSPIGTVGLELENHLVDLDAVTRPVSWERTEPLPSNVLAAVGNNSVSREPGGQLELSGPPHDTLVAAVSALCDDVDRVRKALKEHGIGLIQVGTDPLRPSRRMNPGSRYRAMEEHFTAIRTEALGVVAMSSTASIQVNVEAGPRRTWLQRLAHAHRLGPTLLAISANSPWLHGRPTGWKSMRQRIWLGLDQRRCGPVLDVDKRRGPTDPAMAWARFALGAPVMFVKTGDEALSAVRDDVTFEQWAAGEILLEGRLPTADDLDLHLTTLFPPVRLRGYLELRYLDATPRRWWPAIVAVAVTLMDDPVAADLAAEATEQSSLLWTEAARDGLADARLADSARRCLRIAADRVPAKLSAEVAELAELVESGRSPADVLTARIIKAGPEAAFAELVHW